MSTSGSEMMPAKDPAAVLNYAFDWEPYVTTYDTAVQSYSVEVEGAVLDSHNRVGSYIELWISGGTAFTDAQATCTITTASGITDVRTITIPIRSR